MQYGAGQLASMMKGKKKHDMPAASDFGQSRAKVASAFHEVMRDIPSTVTRANVSGERKRKMKVAIALNKARAAGARIPKK